METGQLILSRQLPKTGMLPLDPPVVGDDAYYYAGWWKGRDYDTNKVRFIAKTIDTHKIVIDRATGLIWPAEGTDLGFNSSSSDTWANAIAYANGLDFAGFEDWRLPNVKELLSLLDYGKIEPCIDGDFFTITYPDDYWTSTSVLSDTSNAFAVDLIDGGVVMLNKMLTKRIVCVRGGL